MSPAIVYHFIFAHLLEWHMEMRVFSRALTFPFKIAYSCPEKGKRNYMAEIDDAGKWDKTDEWIGLSSHTANSHAHCEAEVNEAKFAL